MAHRIFFIFFAFSARGSEWRSAFLLLAALALVAGCDPSSPSNSSCNSDGDCKDGQACIDGVCRERTPTPGDPDSGTEPVPGYDAGPYARPFCPDFPFTTDDCGDPEKEMYIARRDSDQDGLTDLAELCEHGTDPCSEDSDGDGVNDLVETAYGSDPNDSGDNPRERGDFVFVVPYSPDGSISPDPHRDALSFGTDLQKVDVYISIDTSGSMRQEMANLRSSFRTTIVPQLAARIPDVWFGVGRFEDCPGASCANSMNNLQDMTPDVDAVQTALNTLTNTCGGYEPYYQTLWLLATGDTGAFGGARNLNPHPRRCTDPNSIGWPCFRPDAVRIVVQVGDEPMQAESNGCSTSYPGRAETDAANALLAHGIHYIGIDSRAHSCSPRPGCTQPPINCSGALRDEMRRMAEQTGTVDRTTDQPLYFCIPNDGWGLGENLVDAITQFTTNVPIRVDAVAENHPSNPDGVNAVDAFIQELVPNTSGATVEGRLCTDLTTASGGVMGYDFFPSVFPGTSVCFDVVPKPNQSVPATEEPQIFRARIRVIGNRETPLDEREALFLVPPVLQGPS